MHFKISINFCILIAIFVSFSCAKFPDDIKRCKYGDGECIKDTVNKILKTKSSGDPAINLVALNPLGITSIAIKQGAESPVNIDLRFTKSKITGIEKLQLNKVGGFSRDLTGPHQLQMKAEQVSLIGNYDIKGRILVLPISGRGDSNITLVNPDIKMTFKGEPFEKNGKIYMRIKNFKLSFTITRMYMTLENLFNGDKTLGDNMNLFLNENWDDIFNEVKGSIFKAFGLIFENVIGNVFNKFPYDDLFIIE